MPLPLNFGSADIIAAGRGDCLYGVKKLRTKNTERHLDHVAEREVLNDEPALSVAW